MDYQLIRSKRKTIAISFDENCQLIVKAPIWVGKSRIEAFLSEKSEWIEATRTRLLRAKEEASKTRLKLENGDILYFLGEKQNLSVIREERTRGKVVSAMGRIVLHVPYEADYAYRCEQLERWYRKEAQQIISEKVAEFAGRLKVSYEDIRIKDQKSRWGSCSSKGNLNFNWRIVMAPERVCDYVVIHELCHLVYLNHSEQFWSLVESICPEYKQYKKWLKDYGSGLYPF